MPTQIQRLSNTQDGGGEMDSGPGWDPLERVPQLITDLPRARKSPKGPIPASGELCHPRFKEKYFPVKDFTHTAPFTEL